MVNISLILKVFAFVFFAISIYFKPGKWDLTAAGLAFWVASELLVEVN